MAPRNLKANNREQKTLRTGFASLTPRWFFQVKEGEWESLNSEGARFFKQVTGYPPMDFKPEATRKRGRVIDNQESAKAWLSLIGFADLAGDRVTHYFADDEVYEIAFTMRPSETYWKRFSESNDFESGRRDTLESQQGSASQYLLAFMLWQFIRHFVPSAQRYRVEGLEEGVKDGRIEKASGSYTSPTSEQEAYLAGNHTYQTWRLMANMKELLVELASQILVRKYGPLTPSACLQLMQAFDGKDFLTTGEVREVAQSVAIASDLGKEAVFSRICGFLRHVSGQFFEEKQKQLLATSRLRTVLLGRNMACDIKTKVWEINQRKSLDKPWKPEGTTFLDSLPPLDT